jgi:hypothetical protein
LCTDIASSSDVKDDQTISERNIMKTSSIAALLFGIALSPAGFAITASAQDAGAAPSSAPPSAPMPNATLAVGTTIYGPTGDQVGTVETLTPDAVVVNTGTAKATLARSSFGTSTKGPTIGMTKEQLEAAVQQAKTQASSALDSSLTPGAPVRSKDGQPVGKIGSVSGDNVVLDRAAGPVTLKKAMFATDQQGLILGMTAAEFESAAHAATASNAGATKTSS